MRHHPSLERLNVPCNISSRLPLFRNFAVETLIDWRLAKHHHVAEIALRLRLHDTIAPKSSEASKLSFSKLQLLHSFKTSTDQEEVDSQP